MPLWTIKISSCDPCGWAHPHGSHDDIFIVHNGIIENHEEIRDFLRKESYEITSETDSELIAHLIHFYKKDTKDTLKALSVSFVSFL